MSKFDKLYNAIEENKVILGIGPMSFNCIDATLEVANEHDIPIALIASRRQVECEEFGGGYVTNTRTLASYVKERDSKRNIFLTRDHGGPWQGDNETDLDHLTAMERAADSYKTDIESGFDILHLDPSLKDRSLNRIIADINILYSVCERIAHREQREIIYEAGTEEHSGKIADSTNFAYFAQRMKQENEKVKFIVGNMGLWVKEIDNVGKFDEQQAKDLVAVCNQCGLYLKGHNTDYVGDEVLKKHPKIGVHSINVAPEFGVEETKTLLQLFENYKMWSQFEEFVTIAVESNKWVKWMTSPDADAHDVRKAIICGHYVFSDSRVEELKDDLRKKCDLDVLLKSALKIKMISHLIQLGWKV